MYFKKLLTLFLFISTFSYAQNVIKGTITENGKIPVVGATVKLSSSSETKNTLSDINGAFEFADLSGSTYKLTVSSIGFETYSLDVSLNQTLKINLKTTETMLQDVEVLGRARKDYNSDYSFSATKIAIKNKELPQALSTVTKELIADRGAFQLADAVKIASGVSPSSFYNQFNIRGISQNEEGQIINGMRTRQFYFLQPLTTNIERVEVLKGPASVTYSSVDPGGSINMVTKKPLAETRREVSLTAGSFSTVRGALDITGPLNESKTLLYRINGAYQEAQSYRDLVKNNSVLISPSITYLPSDKTAINT
jgi:iron complex outermembrane receptor protein